MSTLYRDKWPLGWQPNSDEFNGDIRGLLRADNLTHDEDGTLSLIRGTKKLSSGAFSGLITELFSVTMNLASKGVGIPDAAKIRYAALNGGQTVLRNYGGAKLENVFDLGLLSGGSTDGVGFGFAFGHVFITSGTKKFKDDGVNQTPIGIPAANTPVISVNPPPTKILSPVSTVDLSQSYLFWELIENDAIFNATLNYVEIDSDPVTFRAEAMRGLTYTVSVDGTALNGIPDTGTSEDIFSMNVRIGDTSTFVRVQVTFMLNAPTIIGYTPDFNDYYELNWEIQNPRPIFVEPVAPDWLSYEDRIEFVETARREFETSNPIEFNSSFNLGIDSWSKLQAKRSDFFRVGTNDSLTWRDIHGIRVTFVDTVGSKNYVFADLKFEGGLNGPLTGRYVYRQVDVQNNNFFLEKSLASEASEEVDTIKTSTQVSTSVVHPQANECWIFRAGGSLNGYYRIKKLTGAKGFNPGTFTDTYSDVDALRDNIKIDDFQQNLPDDIHGMATNFKGRNWYINWSSVFPSYRDNYSAYDSRYVLEIAGQPVEFNLFITKLTNDVLVLATNVDFYQITGSAGSIIEGDVEFFDITIVPMGIKSPPISRSFTVHEGNLFYVAADGIRILSGSNCQLMTDAIDLLFRGHTRHGIPPVKISTSLDQQYYVQISKGRLLFSTVQSDNRRALYIYDFTSKLWRYEDHGDLDSISAIFTEEDDIIIYSTASFGDKFLRQLDIGTKFDETSDIGFKFLTCWDHNGQPRNRKDSYICKVVADSGNKPITVTLRGFAGADDASHDNVFKAHVEVLTFNGRQEKHFPIFNDIERVKYYQLEISGASDVLKLYNFSIDYDPRPEQLSVLRIPPTNFGIAGRKRIYEVPMIIDTLGNAIEFTPILDGISQTTSLHGTTDKTVSTHLFESEKIAFNVGGVLRGTLFEFYELIQPREIELLPDPVRYKFIPYHNLGTGSRKRFIQYAIVIDTRGSNVEMVPIIDGINQPVQIVNTNRKQTIIYTFDSFAVGIDVACTLQGQSAPALPFEFYELNLNETVSEKLPPISSHYQIPCTNLGTSARKRISQFAFVIDTRGNTVLFTPSVDGIPYPPQSYITNRKETCIYTFAEPVVGIDICGTLQSVSGGDFEYYGPALDDAVYEKLPAKVQAYTISCTNYGVAARKRIRTIPMVIDTQGSPVVYTPLVDGVPYPTSTFITNGKHTVLHYFENLQGLASQGIPFGIDYCGTLKGVADFEFYGLLQPENVELLPVGKKFDQFGPIEFNKVGKIREISILMMATGSNLNFRIYTSDSLILHGSIETVPNMERNYVFGVPKGVNPNVFRMEIDSLNVFHRFKSEVRINVDGAVTENKRMIVGADGLVKAK